MHAVTDFAVATFQSAVNIVLKCSHRRTRMVLCACMLLPSTTNSTSDVSCSEHAWDIEMSGYVTSSIPAQLKSLLIINICADSAYSTHRVMCSVELYTMESVCKCAIANKYKPFSNTYML